MSRQVPSPASNIVRTAFVFHPVFLEHNPGRGHPESARRLSAVVQRLEERGLLDRALRLTPEPAPIEAITRVHDASYVRRIEDSSRAGRLFREDADTVGSPATYEAACRAAGAVLAAVDAVMRGDISNAFCAVRPPGHHAERDCAMGFCFFNNVAIGARHLQDRHGLKRVAIIDWDVHHGNGTQNAFYEDPSVFYFSIHQYPHYPGSGTRGQKGSGRGAGLTLNAPVPAGATEADYLHVFREELKPAIDGFKPEFILVSAGFDAHADDPLAGILLTEQSYAALTRLVMDMAEAHCGGRLVSVLEGGYNLDALAASVEAHLRTLMGE